jgi:hypothetical protein
MERTHEPLHLDIWSFVHSNIMDIPVRFIWSLFFLTELFNMAVFQNFEVMLGQPLNYFE